MATDTPERVPVAIKPVSGWSYHAFLGHDRAPIVVLTILIQERAILSLINKVSYGQPTGTRKYSNAH